MKKEETKKVENPDKDVYIAEIKPQIDAMMAEYDAIWNQHWKPVWTESSANQQAVNAAELKEKMEVVSDKYNELSNQIVDLKAENKLTDPQLKEKIKQFENEFVLASSYRANAAKAVNQGLKGLAPMEDRMEEAKKSIDLADQRLLKAVANLTEVESTLGVKRD